MTRPCDMPPIKPQKYLPPLEGERLRIWLTMPRSDGYIINLNYVPKGKLPGYEKLWGKWCREHPRADWPDWLERWVDLKKKAKKEMADE